MELKADPYHTATYYLAFLKYFILGPGNITSRTSSWIVPRITPPDLVWSRISLPLTSHVSEVSSSINLQTPLPFSFSSMALSEHACDPFTSSLYTPTNLSFCPQADTRMRKKVAKYKNKGFKYPVPGNMSLPTWKRNDHPPVSAGRCFPCGVNRSCRIGIPGQ